MKKGKELNQVHDWDSLHCWSPMILSKVTRGQRAYFLKRTGAQSRPCWALACGSLALGISGKPWWWSGALELGCTCSLTPWTEQNNDSANGKNKDAIFFFSETPNQTLPSFPLWNRPLGSSGHPGFTILQQQLVANFLQVCSVSLGFNL